MPTEPVLALIALAVIVNVALMGLVLVPSLLGRRGPLERTEPTGPQIPPVTAQMAAVVGAPADDILGDGVPARVYDRVVRIASWIFILATMTIVTVTGLWPDRQPAIVVLLALAGFFVLVVHDLLPERALGTAKFVLEGSVAVTGVSLLILLSGQQASPFFFAYPVLVAGAALVVPPSVTVVLAAVASAGYVAAVALPMDAQSQALPATVTVAMNLIALCLLAFVATIVAREQRRSRDAAVRLSTVDPLTGLFNRTFLFAALDREIARSSRSGRGFCLLMMDLDELKAANDRFGHFQGDRLLRAVGEIIRGGVRRLDTPARYGGDEFVVLCPETDPTGGFVLAEKIRQGVAELHLEVDGEPLAATLSIGVVASPEDGRTADELVIAADRAMYASKRLGKDRVTGAPARTRPAGVEVPTAGRPDDSV